MAIQKIVVFFLVVKMYIFNFNLTGSEDWDFASDWNAGAASSLISAPLKFASGAVDWRPRSPSSPEEQNAAKYKRILSDLTAEEREITRNLEDELMREDPAIKEATVNPDTVKMISGSQSRLSSRQSSQAGSSTSSDGSSLPSKSSIQLEVSQGGDIDQVIPFNPDAEVGEDARVSTDSPPPESEDARLSNDKSPLQSQEVLQEKEDARNTTSDPPLLNPEPLATADSSEEIPPPSQGTSNELGKFDNDDQQSPSPSPRPQPIVINVGTSESFRDQIMAFNLINANIANANLDNAARPRRGPPTPEHVLISTDMAGNIDTLFHFHEPHEPLDILEAFLNNTINSSAPDEGFDSTLNMTPSAPPPSSNEATFGSSSPPVITINDTIEILDDSAQSQNPSETSARSNQNETINLSSESDRVYRMAMEEREEEDEGEKEEKSHANL